MPGAPRTAAKARIVIGTRSAVFTSLPRLALIVVDEEHDASYKQHEGFRYSARDLAVCARSGPACPSCLGSATPSLETLENVAQGRYAKLILPQRPERPRAPHGLVDLRKHASDQGLSTARHAGHRAPPRRGRPGHRVLEPPRLRPEPVLQRLRLGRALRALRCAHDPASARRSNCAAITAARTAAVPADLRQLRQPLNPVGQGTERVEETLTRLFPTRPSRGWTATPAPRAGRCKTVLDRVHSGEARILVGTQMLTKGHHFPEVSLVVILDADQGLFASDFRATERLAQTITQVAGRAGRAARPGEV
jgi:primosomal protein N' (replication factor Y)